MPLVIEGICRSYVRTPTPHAKSDKGWDNLRRDSQKLFDQFTRAAVLTMRKYIKEERKWLAAVDTDKLGG